MIDKKLKIKTFMFVLIVVFFLQITFIPQFFQGFMPSLILIVLLAGSIADRSSRILYISFVVGFILEIFSDVNFGITIVSILLMVFVVSALSSLLLKKLYSLNLFLISVIGILTYNTIYIFIININKIQSIFYAFNQLFYIVVFQIIFTLIFIYPLTYSILQKNEE